MSEQEGKGGSPIPTDRLVPVEAAEFALSVWRSVTRSSWLLPSNAKPGRELAASPASSPFPFIPSFLSLSLFPSLSLSFSASLKEGGCPIKITLNFAFAYVNVLCDVFFNKNWSDFEIVMKDAERGSRTRPRHCIFSLIPSSCFRVVLREVGG